MRESSSFQDWEEEQAEREQDRLVRETKELRTGFARLTEKTGLLEAHNAELKAALAHCIDVFESQAERGAYPKELLPDCSEFLGKPGFKFARDLLEKKP